MAVSSYLHGVEQLYIDNPDIAIPILAASTIGLIATADDADVLAFPLNQTVLVHSDKLLAKAGTTGTLRHALQDIFLPGAAIVLVTRVAEDVDEATQIAAVIGTVDNESGTYTGLQTMLAAESKLGLRPRLIIAPEFSHLTGVGAAMEVVAKKLKAIPIIDGDESGYSNVIAAAGNYDEVLFVNCGVRLFDAFLEAEVTRKASAVVAGHMVYVDGDEGYWHSPSSRKIMGILGTSELIDHAIGSSTSLANLYNAQNVSVIIQQDGGFYFFGNRLTNGGLITHQRVRYMVGDSISYAHQLMLDRNVTKGYVEGVKNNVNKLVRRLIKREVISGGKCWIPEELNVASIGTNQVFWDYDLGLFDVAERMTFRQHINNDYNEQVFG